MEKIIFLDFDGVLFDTVDEAYQICINSDTFKNEKLPKNSLELFRKFRPLVGPAWNYYFIMNSIIGFSRITNTNFINSAEAQKFELDFFHTRNRLKNENYNDWLKFNKKYVFLDELEKIVDDNFKIFIITTKDKKTVIDLLYTYRINFIKDENIMSKVDFNKFGSKKAIILNQLINKKYKALFIDDLYYHLKGCEDIYNLQLIQADWGYVDIDNPNIYICSIQETLTK